MFLMWLQKWEGDLEAEVQIDDSDCMQQEMGNSDNQTKKKLQKS